MTLSNATVCFLRGQGDFTPADWGAELPLQDIPWSQLAWVCSLGRPLDFIPTSHIQRVRLAFIHCLQAVIDSPNEYYLWKRVCLLPTILFIDIGKCRRADLDAKVKLILATVGHSRWAIFREGWRGRYKPRTIVANSHVWMRSPRPRP